MLENLLATLLDGVFLGFGQGFTLILRNCAIWEVKLRFHLYLIAILSDMCILLCWCYWSKGMLYTYWARMAFFLFRVASSSSIYGVPSSVAMSRLKCLLRQNDSNNKIKTKPSVEQYKPSNTLTCFWFCLQNKSWPLAKQLHPRILHWPPWI